MRLTLSIPDTVAPRVASALSAVTYGHVRTDGGRVHIPIEVPNGVGVALPVDELPLAIGVDNERPYVDVQKGMVSGLLRLALGSQIASSSEVTDAQHGPMSRLVLKLPVSFNLPKVGRVEIKQTV